MPVSHYGVIWVTRKPRWYLIVLSAGTSTKENLSNYTASFCTNKKYLERKFLNGIVNFNIQEIYLKMSIGAVTRLGAWRLWRCWQ